eukprot:8666921-Karenia_brevis.AAC.1
MKAQKKVEEATLSLSRAQAEPQDIQAQLEKPQNHGDSAASNPQHITRAQLEALKSHARNLPADLASAALQGLEALGPIFTAQAMTPCGHSTAGSVDGDMSDGVVEEDPYPEPPTVRRKLNGKQAAP